MLPGEGLRVREVWSIVLPVPPVWLGSTREAMGHRRWAV